jgi:signal transduction histidine kinase/CheY-like chemotaxis protein
MEAGKKLVRRRRSTSHSLERLHMAVREVMSCDVVCVFADLGLDTLEELLLDRDLSGVPVIDTDRRLIGYVAMTDIVREHHDRSDDSEPSDTRMRWGFHAEAAPRTVADVMSPVAFELPESCSLVTAIEMMTSRHIHRVPVVSDDGVLVGIVTASDVLRFLARDQRPEPRSAAADRRVEADRVVSLGFLASSLAHQVNNVLTPMRLTLGRLTSFELSRRPMSASRLHRVELLQDLREGVDRVERVVRELRVFSHTDDAPARPVELADVLDSALALAEHEIRHRAVLVRDYRRIPRVEARFAELRQVFLNLVLNAAQAIPEGEAHVNQIRVTTRTDDNGRALVEIEDSGTGIAPDALPRIFEPFFTTRPAGAALGLGLAVTRDVVTALAGEIAVDSVLGKGTTIRVSLPACDVASASPPVEQPRRRDSARHHLRILIVDDDRPVAAAIALELGDHDVVVAESGREALELLRRDRNFDVILCDLMMPEISGMDVYDAVRYIDPALLTRIVLMTGGAFTRRANDFLTSVDAPVLEKPFDPGRLHEVVGAVDRRSERADGTMFAAGNDLWQAPEPAGKES